MLSDFMGAAKVYIAYGYTDSHCRVDGLSTLAQREFSLDPFTSTLFLFCCRRRDRIKVLFWSGDGYVTAVQMPFQRTLPVVNVGSGALAFGLPRFSLAHETTERRAKTAISKFYD